MIEYLADFRDLEPLCTSPLTTSDSLSKLLFYIKCQIFNASFFSDGECSSPTQYTAKSRKSFENLINNCNPTCTVTHHSLWGLQVRIRESWAKYKSLSYIYNFGLSYIFLDFQGLNTEDYRRVMKVVEQAILSTDLALYFRKKDRFLETANCGEIDWQEQEKKECKLYFWQDWTCMNSYGNTGCGVFKQRDTELERF